MRRSGIQANLDEPIPYVPLDQEPLLTETHAPLSDEFWASLVNEAASMMGCTAEQLRRSRRHTSSRGRRLVAQIALDLEQTYEEIGRHQERSSPAIHRLVHRPLRDPTSFAGQIEELTRRLADLLNGRTHVA